LPTILEGSLARWSAVSKTAPWRGGLVMRPRSGWRRDFGWAAVTQQDAALCERLAHGDVP